MSSAELENFADAETLADAVARGLLTEYQLYFLTLAGTAVRREEFELRNDKDTLAHAKQFVDGLALELWSGARMVGRLESEEASGAKEDRLIIGEFAVGSVSKRSKCGKTNRQGT